MPARHPESRKPDCTTSRGIRSSIQVTRTSPLIDPHELAVGTRSAIRVVCRPFNGPRYGQAFCDIFDESVEYHHVPHRPYHSFIRGDRFRIETDSAGCPIFVEVRSPFGAKDRTPPSLSAPGRVRPGSLEILDLRILFHETSVHIDKVNALIYIQLTRMPPTEFISTGPGISWGVSSSNHLCGLWISRWRTDPSGLARVRWRRRSWDAVYRRISARRTPGGIMSVSAGQPKDFAISTIFA
jgi:hypothetical protein